jgi:ATP-dependent RNA helicase RhlE
LTTFSDLGLAAPLLKALESEGYTTPTPIQAKAIPVVMTGADLLGIAQTGTGKTAAFALPILHRLAADPRPAPRKGCRVLVLSPTRELATQIGDSFRTYGKNMGVSVAVIFGGVGYKPQISALMRGVDVLVATPGRLIDHIESRHAVLSGTEIFILDEADQMLDLGFFKPIRRIVATLSQKRQNLFFSATMPGEIGKLADDLLDKPTKVSVAPSATTVERVNQRVIHARHAQKKDVLVELLADAGMSRSLVFTRTKRSADRVAQHLSDNKIGAAAIHGNKSQGQRERALEEFRQGRTRVLVATDIAARGIDIDQVSHVVNFDLPEVPEAYVHRIGRTARAGAEGIAISFCDPEERGLLRDIERLTRQTIAAESRIGAIDASAAADERRPVRQGRPQHRGDRGGRPGQRSEGQRSGGQRSEHRREQRPDRREDRHPERRDDRRDSGFRAPAAERGHGAEHRANGHRPHHADRDGARAEHGRSQGRAHARPHDQRPHTPDRRERPEGAARPHGERPRFGDPAPRDGHRGKPHGVGNSARQGAPQRDRDARPHGDRPQGKPPHRGPRRDDRKGQRPQGERPAFQGSRS